MGETVDCRKIIVNTCYDCKWQVYRWPEGDFCYNLNISITKIPDANVVPGFCPLEFD